MKYINQKNFNENRKEKNFHSVYIVLDIKTRKTIMEVEIYDAGKPNTKTTNITVDFDLPNLKVVNGAKSVGVDYYRPNIAFTDALLDTDIDSNLYSSMWNIETNLKSLLTSVGYNQDDYILLNVFG